MDPAALPAVAEPATPAWAWFVFGGIILSMLLLDLIVFERTPHERRMKESTIWCVVWILLAAVFNGFVWQWKGRDRAFEFTTAYLLELSLSVDNLFIFLVVFRFFGVAERHRPRVLFWGILGAFVMRGILIVAGVGLVHRFEWLLYVFGVVLLFTGVKLFVMPDESYDPEKTFAYRIARWILPLSPRYHEQHFFVHEGGRRLATPLFLVLVVLEATDLVFAVDSIPACIAISQDTFIVLTSNLFAILGLRSMYFVLAGLMKGLRFLKPGLAIVLVFIGLKMVLAEAGKDAWLPAFLQPVSHIPVGASLGIVGGLLAIAVVASLLFPKSPGAEKEEEAHERHATWVQDGEGGQAGKKETIGTGDEAVAGPKDAPAPGTPPGESAPPAHPPAGTNP